jgi:hypothetical protein
MYVEEVAVNYTICSASLLQHQFYHLIKITENLKAGTFCDVINKKL